MPSLFRSPNSSSGESSSSASRSSEEDDTIELSQGDVSAGASSVDALEVVSSLRPKANRSGDGIDARDLMIHALLEERSVNHVRREYEELPAHKRPDKATIQREGRERYRKVCELLAPYDLLTLGLEGDDKTSMRQSVRDRLDKYEREGSSALQSASPSRPALPVLLRRLLTESDATTSRSSPDPGSPASFFSGLSRFHQQPLSFRYDTDFEEIGLLGKGGYGQVYEVRHRLDGRAYAVKKVPVRPALAAKIAGGDEDALNHLLAEVRSLSRLEHPNVVRYFSSWVDQSTRSGFATSSSEPLSPSTRNHSRNFTDSLHGVKTESETGTIEDIGFSFETRSQHSLSRGISSDPDSGVTFSHSGTGGALMRIPESALTLHVQMDVYPMTLADFIFPKPTQADNIAPLAHCFHLEPSISILTAILDGVEYIHSKGIVHRDLKPANIFLRHEENPGGCVDLSLCSACRADNKQQPALLSVRIGDFGLVTNIAHPADPTSSPVGTEIYRPTKSKSNVSPRLDIFAVGIMACELLCKFGTQMERRETLHELRQRRFPKRFEGCADHVSSKVKDCMEYMLSEGREEEITATELKRQLQTILDSSRGAERAE